MKNIFTFSLVAIFISVFYTGCIKENTGYDENYWLSQEQGKVVYSDYCDYFVVETAYGYNILRALSSYKPPEGTIVYGNFSNYGVRDFYNRLSRRIFTADVKEYSLSYNGAQQAVYYYCPYGRNQFNKASSDTTSRK